jgi:hypothetical protein
MTAYTLEDGEPQDEPAVESESPAKSAWWKWTCPQTHTYEFNTIGSNLTADGHSTDEDTVMAVWIEGEGLTAVVGNDDQHEVGSLNLPQLPPDERYASAVIFNATEGVTYFIQVESYEDFFVGTYVLNWMLTDVSPDS